MPMPATHPVTSSTPKWLQALTLPPQQLLQLLPAVQESQLSFSNNNSTAAAAAAWRLLPSVSPAWELVRQQAAAAVPQDQQEHQQQPQQQQQQQVELPCLRLFLRNARDIRAAYIPSLDEWLQSDVPADAAVADV
jgi:hypothetical protein